MTAIDAKNHLLGLRAERRDAADAGLGQNALYSSSLERDIAAASLAYVGLAVTEIAILRASISGPQTG